MTYYTREDWGSQYPRGGWPITGPLTEVYVHHFNSGITPPQTVADSMARIRSAQAYHAVTQGWGDLGYSFVVDDAGNLYEGRGIGRTGAHTFGYNSYGYAWCWLGDSNVSRPTVAALTAIGDSVRRTVAAGALTPSPTIVAHRDRTPDTGCCGDVMYSQLGQIRALVAGPAQPPPTEIEEDDMATRAFIAPGGAVLLVTGDRARSVKPGSTWADVQKGIAELHRAGQLEPHRSGALWAELSPAAYELLEVVA